MPRRWRYHLFGVSDLVGPSYIVRRSLKKTEDYLDSLGEVRIDALVNVFEELYGLSSSLLGTFLPEHAKLFVDGKNQPYWRPGSQVPKSQRVKFSVVDCPVVFFCVQDLDNTVFPLEKTLRKGVQEFTGTCRLIHRPTIFNFWHFELAILGENQEEIKKSDSKWKIQAAEFIIKSFLKINAMTQTPVFAKIPKGCYSYGWLSGFLRALAKTTS